MEAGGKGPGFSSLYILPPCPGCLVNASPLPNDILSGPLMVKDDVNAEEGVHEELGMELPGQRIYIKYRRRCKKTMLRKDSHENYLRQDVFI
jgi:hypothetical protein